AIKSIIRAKGGTREREVRVSDIVIYDIRSSPLFLPDERWIPAVERYYEDLGLLLGAVRADLDLPAEFFVPDLWDTSIRLPGEEREMCMTCGVWGTTLRKEWATARPTQQTSFATASAIRWTS